MSGTDSARAAREEADLMAQLAAGNIDGPATELYHRYAGRMYGFALRLLGDAGLAHDQGLSQAEIAQVLDIPLGTVKTRMYHGLRALRAALTVRGFDV